MNNAINYFWIVLAVAIIGLFGMIFCQTCTVFKNSCDYITHKANVDSITYIINEDLFKVIHLNKLPEKGNIVAVDPSFVGKIDSMAVIINTLQKDIITRQEHLINDIRQETNNNLDKMSAWLSFWIAVLALLGVFVPFAFQFFVYKRDEERLRQYRNKVESLNSKVAFLNIKLIGAGFVSLSEHNMLADNANPQKIWDMTCNGIKTHIRQIKESLSSDGEISKDSLLSIYASLLNLLSVASANSEFTREQKRRMQKFQDYIREWILDIVDEKKATKELVAELSDKWRESYG